MEPHSRSIPNVTNGEFSDAELFQDLHENEHCPEGTIPIIRHAREDEYYPHGAISAAARNQKKLNIRVDLDAKGHEYAGVGLSGGKYYGARAFLNVWKPATLGNGDLSFAQVGVQAGPPDRLNYIQAGWMVNSRDNEPRVFLYWTSDGNKKTGCYNLNCPGFVQVTNKIGLGAALKPPSTYKGTQFSIPIAVYQFRGNWWLQVNEIMLGYLPSHIFTDLRTSATAVSWGGQVFDAGKMGHHTSTQMGSGHFASEGFGKASYFTHVEYKHETGYFLAAEGLRQYQHVRRRKGRRKIDRLVLISHILAGGIKIHVL
ncbi:protein neprosin-like [Alnus glutinosa]|uniref:protein neprosin-like n=1 Tax=Alnus glutinosa TaxID=3517 RepID=UPI002D78A823|nr:protein neprosin-like [Alnus glutinosa]